MVDPYTCTSLVPLGCVCFGFKSLLEILFCKCGCLFAYEKWIFRKRILVDRKIKAFDPKNIFCQNFTFKSFPKTRKERKRERKDSQTCKQRERERSRQSDCRPHPLHATVRSRHEPMNWSTHLVHRRDRAMNPQTDRPIPHPHWRTHELIAPRLVLWFWFFFVLIFVSCVVYMLQLSVIIFVWILRKCEKHDKNGFSRAFSAKQPNTRKYFPKYFLECNQTLENILYSKNIL